MASVEKEFMGITTNDCFLQGRVIGDPKVEVDKFAFFVLRTKEQELGENGAWASIIVDIPIITEDKAKIKMISTYIKNGRELRVHAYYKSWTVDGKQQHAFFPKKIQLGRKKWETAGE